MIEYQCLFFHLKFLAFFFEFSFILTVFISDAKKLFLFQFELILCCFVFDILKMLTFKFQCFLLKLELTRCDVILI